MKFETDRLIIVPFEKEHIHGFLDFYNQEEVMRFVGNGNYDWSETQLLEKIAKFSTSDIFTIHAIILKETSEIIGELSVFDSFNTYEKVEIGYILNSKYWGLGYTTELLKSAILKIKSEFEVESIIANINQQNKASIAICEKLDFKCIDNQFINNNTRFTYII